MSQQTFAYLVVEEVTKDSPAAKAGVQPDDRILSYDDKRPTSPAALDALQENATGKKDVVLEVRRAEQILKLAVPPGTLRMQVRPELEPGVKKLYEEGRLAFQAKDSIKGAEKWESAAILATQQGDSGSAGWLYFRLGKKLAGERQWKNAGAAYHVAWQLLQHSGNPATRSRIVFGLGDCSENQSDFPTAEKWFTQAQILDHASGNQLWEATDLTALAAAAFNRGDLAASQEFDSRALAIRERLIPDSQEVAMNLANHGATAWAIGDLAAAEDYTRRALAIQERLAPDSLALSSALDNLGSIVEDRGNLAAAQDYASRALAIRERLDPNSLNVANSFQSLGNIARDRGDLAAAHDYYSRALVINERLAPDSPDVAGSLSNLSNIASDRGDWVAAQDYGSRALAIQERLAPHSREVALYLNNLGAVAADRHDLAAAQNYYNRALAIEKQVAPDSLTFAGILGNLGDIAVERADLASALKYENQALAIQEQLAPDSLIAAVTLNNLGNIAKDRGDWAATQQYLNRAFAIKEHLAPDSLTLAVCLNSLGDFAYKQSRFTDAQSFFTRAIAIVESQRTRIPSADARSLLLAKHQDVYRGLLRVELALHDLPAAFYTVERARARGLLDLLAESHIDVRQGIEPALLQRERSLQEDLNGKALRQARLLEAKHAAKDAAEASQEIDTLTAAFHEVQANIRASSPHYAALTQPQPSSLEQIQQQVLDKDSLLLEYALGDDASYLFAVTPASIKSYELPKRKEIEALARQTYEAFTARNQNGASKLQISHADAEYPQLAARLSSMILAPAAAELGHKRLLIVADGMLLQIPFAALADPTVSHPQPLLVSHEIVNLPSASVWAEQRQELAGRRPAVNQLALLADPVFQAEDERIKGRTASVDLADARRAVNGTGTQPEIDLDQAVREAALSDNRSGIQRLWFSRKEADTISSYAQRNKLLKALDFDASKTTASSGKLSQYRIVHFATHALLNNEHPELSGIVLSLFDRQGQSVDGFLRLNEIYNLNLPADLVVLSACETGLGREVKGEGLIGLTRGFFYAGAERVVGSLWKVDDAATAELMGRFYEKLLKEGEPAASALRHAQLEMIEQGRRSRAYFWAAFTIQGEWK